MIIYSPKAQNVEVFRKNTVRNKMTYNRKVASSGTTIEFEYIYPEQDTGNKKKEKGPNAFDRFFDFLKEKFYNRMRVYFEFEDKYSEKQSVFDLADES